MLRIPSCWSISVWDKLKVSCWPDNVKRNTVAWKIPRSKLWDVSERRVTQKACSSWTAAKMHLLIVLTSTRLNHFCWKNLLANLFITLGSLFFAHFSAGPSSPFLAGGFIYMYINIQSSNALARSFSVLLPFSCKWVLTCATCSIRSLKSQQPCNENA